MTRKIAKIAVATTAFGSIGLAVVPPVQAQAEGLLCSFTSTTDPVSEPDTQTGEIEGGPLTATSTDPNAPSADPSASMTLKCTVQVGATGATHVGPDAASASASATGVVVLAPTTISYALPEDSSVYLCTQVTVNGSVYYYDETNGVWSMSASVDCALAISQSGYCFRSYHQGELVVWDTGWACVDVTLKARRAVG